MADRMPVFLWPEQEERWLEAPPQDAEQLLGPLPAEFMRKYSVSALMNSPRNDQPEVLQTL